MASKGREGMWCILRMGSAATLPVFEALQDAGFDVWTPVEHKLGRMPRSRKSYDRTFAIMPSYIFAAAKHIEELMKMAMVPTLDSPRFTMFKHEGGFPLIAEAQLAELREHEAKLKGIYERQARKGMKGPVFSAGQDVKVPEGGFAGLPGVVIGQTGQFTLVDFPGFVKPIKIASILLVPDGVINEQSEDCAAQEAA